MFNPLRWKRDLDALLREKSDIEELRGLVKRESEDLRRLIEHAAGEVQTLLDRLAEAGPAMLRCEEALEHAQEGTIISNDAQAARYNEISRRLADYDVVFRKLGIVIERVTAT